LSEGWERYWAGRRVDHQAVERELASDRWKLIKKAVLDRFGSMEGREVIEIGSGKGTNGLCMALRGAKASVLDINDAALERAKELFAAFHVMPRVIRQNILDPLNPALAGSFGVVMSFGLAEHFIGSERAVCLRRHFDLAKPGGIVIISVPNESSFIVKLDDALLSLARRWKWGWERISRRKSFDWDIEVPFRRDELDAACGEMSREFKTYATNLAEGLNNLLRWFRYPFEAIKLGGLASRLRWRPGSLGRLDRRWGVSLVFLGEKK